MTPYLGDSTHGPSTVPLKSGLLALVWRRETLWRLSWKRWFWHWKEMYHVQFARCWFGLWFVLGGMFLHPKADRTATFQAPGEKFEHQDWHGVHQIPSYEICVCVYRIAACDAHLATLGPTSKHCDFSADFARDKELAETSQHSLNGRVVFQ